MELDELLELFCQGKITSEQMQEEIIKKDAYSGKEVAKAMYLLIENQKKLEQRINGLENKLLQNYVKVPEKKQDFEPEEEEEWEEVEEEEEEEEVVDYLYGVDIGDKIDWDKLKKNLEQKLKSAGYNISLQKAKDMREYFKNEPKYSLLCEKAKFLAEQDKLDEAADLLYAADLYEAENTPLIYAIPNRFSSFCQSHKRIDSRIIYTYTIMLKRNIQKIKPDSDDAMILKNIERIYFFRAKAYDFLGMKAEARKDREARQKLLEQI